MNKQTVVFIFFPLFLSFLYFKASSIQIAIGISLISSSAWKTALRIAYNARS